MGNCINKNNLNEKKTSFFDEDVELRKSDDKVQKFSFKGKSIKAKIVRVYDGDTFWCCFYLDNKIQKFNCRCLGYDSPEMKPKNKPEEEKIKEKAAAEIAKQKFIEYSKSKDDLVILKCHEFDKYGRILVEVFVNEEIISVNQKMIDGGYGYPYDGGTKTDFSKI